MESETRDLVSFAPPAPPGVQTQVMEDALPPTPDTFPERMLLPHLDDDWTEVRLGRRSDGAWEVYVVVRVDEGYRSEASAQAVADHYRESLEAFVEHRRRGRLPQ